MTAWRLEVHEERGSTSDDCVARAKAGEPAGLAVLAHWQTAGRGSRGRSWVAPVGNLNLSVLLRPELPAAQAGVFALLAGLAAAEAVQNFLPFGSQPLLKWPNDVLLDNAKLGGVLIDAAPNGQRLDWLVIGIGLNLAAAPEIIGRATTTLSAHGGCATAEAAASAVLRRLGHWLDILGTAGIAPVHEAWLAHAHPIGTELAITGATTARGRFAGLSPASELLLADGNTITRINTGDVLLGR